jgi:phosphatidylglycerophosphate synthase
MLDSKIQTWVHPAFNKIGKVLGGWGVTANTVSLAGLVLAITAAVAIALQSYLTGLGLFLISRLLDGLDGAVARATQKTDVGGFLDISFDFLSYAFIPLGFAIADPNNNALATCILLTSFIGTGTSFLAYAIFATKHHMSHLQLAKKSFYYLQGLTEATETIGVFVLMCLFPQYFATLAYIFALLCFITTLLRLQQGYKQFRHFEN